MIYDKLEDAGHVLTFMGSVLGSSRYYCENCGALIFLRDGKIELFHVPAKAISTVERCVYGFKTGYAGPEVPPTLKSKLEELERQDYERLKEI